MWPLLTGFLDSSAPWILNWVAMSLAFIVWLTTQSSRRWVLVYSFVQWATRTGEGGFLLRCLVVYSNHALTIERERLAHCPLPCRIGIEGGGDQGKPRSFSGALDQDNRISSCQEKGEASSRAAPVQEKHRSVAGWDHDNLRFHSGG